MLRFEDDEEEIGDDAKKDHSPFQRTKVNKAQERQRIIEWARKRQPQAQPQVRQAVEIAAVSAGSGVGPAPVRTSASAPALRQLPAAESNGTSNVGVGGLSVANGGTLPVIGEGKAERAAAFTAQHGSAPPLPAGPAGLKSSGISGCAQRLRASASASMPAPTSTVPKDLGTVIYLLGTQSNSMNARRFLDGRSGQS